ncbi:MAG: hypothetical protein P1P85_01260 [Patescibacteria group bacterium]|nr:hypothetical protein [Patescibacteria group bacterium]
MYMLVGAGIGDQRLLGKPKPAKLVDKGKYIVFSPRIEDPESIKGTLVLPLRKEGKKGSEVIIVFSFEPDDSAIYDNYAIGERMVIR